MKLVAWIPVAAGLTLLTIACGGAPESGSFDPTPTPSTAATVPTPAPSATVAPLSTSEAATVNLTPPSTSPNVDSGAQVQTFGNDAAPDAGQPVQDPWTDAGADPDSGPALPDQAAPDHDSGPDASPDAGTAEYCAPGIPAECYLDCTPGTPWQCIASGKSGFRYNCRFDISVPSGASVHTLAGDTVGTYPPSGGNCWTP